MAYTDKEIIEKVKGWNFGFICVNPNVGYSGSSRIIKLQHLISKEIVTCSFKSAGRNQVCFPKYNNLKAKNELNKFNYGWVCLESWIDEQDSQRIAKLQHSVSKEIISCNYQSAKINNIRFHKTYEEQENLKVKNELNKFKKEWICLDAWSKKYQKLVKIKHLISKEIIIIHYQNAKKNNVYFPKHENLKAKEKLNKLNLGYVCLDTWIGKKYRRMAKLQHLISKEIITTQYYSVQRDGVFFPKYANLKAKEELNKLRYGWVCLESYIKNKARVVKLQHLISKEIITSEYHNAKRNQVLFPKYEDIKRFENVKKLGLKANPQYVCIESNVGKDKHNNFLVLIKRKDGIGEIKTSIYSHLQKGSNPYNEDQDRVEINEVQPKYEKVFKILNISYNKQFRLAKGSMIDFKLTHKNSKKSVVVEVKQSGKFWGYSKEQKSRYTKLANKRKDISKIYFSDPKGTHRKHGFISIKELAKKLIKDFNLNPSKLKSITSL